MGAPKKGTILIKTIVTLAINVAGICVQDEIASKGGGQSMTLDEFIAHPDAKTFWEAKFRNVRKCIDCGNLCQGKERCRPCSQKTRKGKLYGPYKTKMIYGNYETERV
jgi:hypothetical protein